MPLPSLIQCHYLIIKWSIHQDNATMLNTVQVSSFEFSRSVMCNSLRRHELQHAITTMIIIDMLGMDEILKTDVKKNNEKFYSTELIFSK